MFRLIGTDAAYFRFFVEQKKKKKTEMERTHTTLRGSGVKTEREGCDI